MAAQAQAQIDPAIAQPDQPRRWAFATRVGFRICFLYLTLYCLSNQILHGLWPVPKVPLPELGILPPVRAVIFWVGQHWFGTAPTLVYTGSGSGDKTYDWVFCFCALLIAALGTAVWSVLDRK